MPAEGLAFLISAISDILLLTILFSIFSLKLIKVLFPSIFSFKDSIEIIFFNSLSFCFFFIDYFI